MGINLTDVFSGQISWKKNCSRGRSTCGNVMEAGIEDKMEDDDWGQIIRKSKARHKYSDDESEKEIRVKRSKQNGDRKRKQDKYQTTRDIADDDEAKKQNGDADKNAHAQIQNTEQPHTMSMASTKPKTDLMTKRQNKDKTDGNYNDNWTKNHHYTTFIIEKETKENDKEKGIKHPHPMEVAKMLKNIGVTKYSSMKGVGRGKFQISFDKPRDAEQLLNSDLLKNSFGYTIFVPTRFKESIGVVGDVPPSITDQEVMENVVCENNIKVFKVERINKRIGENRFQPTYSIKIFVRGEKLPKSLEIYGTRRSVEPYVFPLKICVKCWRFGHRDKFCKSREARCCNCGQEHTEDKCDSMEPKCVNCAGIHKASSKECPERSRQDLIRQDMAINKTSYFEASDKYPRHTKQNLQARLDSIRDFPQLENNKPRNIQNNTQQTKQQRRRNDILTPHFQTPQNLFNTQNIHHDFSPNPYRTTEIEKITQIIKDDLIRQFNLNNLFDKIKTIQKTIIQSANKTDSIDQDLLLIDISEELNKIINPEVNELITSIDKLSTNNA